MVELIWNKYDKMGVPIIDINSMEDYAKKLICDFKPSLLKEPQPFPFDEFIEIYLGATLAYWDIRDEEHEEILGLTTFDEDYALVFEENKIGLRPLAKGMIVLQENLADGAHEGRLRFTALHESAHFLMHQGYFVNENFETKQKSILCRDSVVGKAIANSKQNKTSEEWMEYQADYMASALAIPRSLFTQITKRILRENDFRRGFITLGVDEGDDWFATCELPTILSEAFGVSKQAAKIKLSQLGLIRG